MNSKNSITELLQYAAKRASRLPFFLAADLEQFRWERGFQETDVADFLGCVPELLPKLALCRRPDPGSARFHSDIHHIAQAFGFQPERLLQLIRETEALKAMGGVGETVEQQMGRGLLIAARDVEIDESITPPTEHDEDYQEGC